MRQRRGARSLRLVGGLLASLILACAGQAASASAASSAASSGSLDTTFGQNGVVLTKYASGGCEGRAVVVQPNGKIVAAGFVANGQTTMDFAVTRYLPNGSLDHAFGTGGRVQTDFAGSDDHAYAVALQSDGKILAAGDASPAASRGYSFGLARYTTSGRLDPSFGSGGRVTIGFLGDEDAHAMGIAVQPDGKIVLAGFSDQPGPYHFALARVNTDGSLDTSFGVAGRVTTDFSGEYEVQGRYINLSSSNASSWALQLAPDGTLVAAGDVVDNASSRAYVAMARYMPDGSLDSTFGKQGRAVAGFAGYSSADAMSLALLPSGQILVGGGVLNASNGARYLALARFNHDGGVDSSFGHKGLSVTLLYNEAVGSIDALALQPDGRIIAAGWVTLAYQYPDWYLGRYLPNGRLDDSFGHGGHVTASPSGGAGDWLSAVALQPDGRIVVGGTVYTSDGAGILFSLAVARYLP